MFRTVVSEGISWSRQVQGKFRHMSLRYADFDLYIAFLTYAPTDLFKKLKFLSSGDIN